MINRVAGLRGMGERPRVGTANRGRVATSTANDMRTPGLRPTAAPVDAYARPEAPAEGNDLLQFAQSLGVINPKLQTMLDNDATARREQAENRASRRLGGMTYEQHRDFVRAGGPEMQDPWFKAAAMRLFGERQGLYRSNQLSQDYATSFDKENGNIDEFIASAMAEDLEAWGNDKHFMGSYTPMMEDFRGRAFSQHTADVSEIAVNQARDGIYEVFYGTASQMRSNGASPEDIAKVLHERYEGNKNLLNVSYQDQDREWVRMAEAFAEQGDLDMVKALLNGSRTGADGTILGALSENRNFAASAAQIITRATNVHESNNQAASLAAQLQFDRDASNGVLDQERLLEFHLQNPGAFTGAGVRSLISSNENVIARAQAEAARAEAEAALQRQAFNDRNAVRRDNLGLVESNRVPFIQDAIVRNERGEETVVTVAQQQAWLVDDINEQIEVIRDQQGLTNQQAFDLKAAQFTLAGLNNPEWESILSSGPVAATAWSLSGEPPTALVEGAELYMQLHEKSPMLLNRHVTDGEVRRFYETYRTAVTLGRMEPSQAYSHASNLIRNPPIDNPMTRLSADELRSAVGEIGNGLPWWEGGPANNEGEVSDWLLRTVADFGAMGTMTAGQARAEAIRVFRDTHTNINGNWVDTSDRSMPPNFEDLAKTVIEDYVRDFPDEGLVPGDLTLSPDANGSWQLILKGGYPIPVENPSRRYVTLFDMQVALDARTLATQEALQQTVQGNQQELLERHEAERQGYLPQGGEPGVFYKPGTYERYRAEYQEGSPTPIFTLISSGSNHLF